MKDLSFEILTRGVAARDDAGNAVPMWLDDVEGYHMARAVLEEACRDIPGGVLLLIQPLYLKLRAS